MKLQRYPEVKIILGGKKGYQQQQQSWKTPTSLFENLLQSSSKQKV